MDQFAVYKTDVGYIKIDYHDNQVTSLQKVEDPIDFGKPTELTELVFSQLKEYFAGQRKTFDFPIVLNGTDFQKRVWQALIEIPYGETRTYKEIAQAVGNEKASRAVGMANNKNHVAIAIPCHRVIGTNGKLVGYAGGLEMKEYLLTLEKENC